MRLLPRTTMSTTRAKARFIILSSILTTIVGCGGSTVEGPIPQLLNPDTPVTLQAEWRTELVDVGVWAFEPVEMGQISTSVDGNVAYVGTSEGRMVAVSTNDGSLVWEHTVGEPIDGQPVVDGRQLFFGAADGRLHAVSAAGGRENWGYHAGGNVSSRPAILGDALILARADGVVVRLDTNNGAPMWSAENDDAVLRVTRGLYPPVKGQPSPTIDGDRVFVGFPNGRISSLNMSDGEILWTADLAGSEVRHTDVDEPAVLIGDTLFATSFSGGFYALNPDDGTVLWRQDLRGATRPIAFGGNIYTTTVDGYFLALDAATGELDFRIRLESRAPGRIHRVGNYALVSTSEGGLYVLDVQAPHIHALFSPSSGFASISTAPGGRVIALDHHGVLHGLTVRTR